MLALVFAVASAGCAAPSRSTAAAPSVDSDAGADEADASTSPATSAASKTLPMSCANEKSDVCVPDAAFVKRLCDGSFPDVALVLMGKDAPFTRMYMKADVDGWNAEGGASARARLAFGEEMLVLRRRLPPANGIVVGSGGAGYLVMRWDGNCYTVDDSELGANKPSSPKHAPIPFRFYSERTKSALLEHPKILAAYQKRGKECKGATSGSVTKACEQADAALSTAIVAEIRGGATIPTPDKLP
ncbi:MAG TPA: hypothetical protein VIF62_28805 [Labilithrix sp.]